MPHRDRHRGASDVHGPLRVRALALAAAALVPVACTTTDLADRPEPPGPSGAVVVASFDFAESRVLAEVYAQALEATGVTVERQLGLGTREMVLPALRQGFVDVVPEYAGSLLDALDAGATADRTDIVSIEAALDEALQPLGLAALAPAPAMNRNVVVVTRQFAEHHRLSSVSDLAASGREVVVGGPPECPSRVRCLGALRDGYGVAVSGFVPLGGEALVQRSLDQGVIDVGVLFETDAVLSDALPSGAELTVLEDDRRVQPADHVVPLVRSAAVDDRITATLDAVSAQLTTEGLRFLNWRVAHAGTTAAEEAHGWLVRHGLALRG